MPKFLHNDIFDNGLSEFAAQCDEMTICTSDVETTGVPNYIKCSSTSALIDTPIALTGGSFAITDGDASGRKVTIAEQADVTIDTTGTAEHICLLDSVNSKVLAITTTPSEGVTATNQVSVPAFDIELLDPV